MTSKHKKDSVDKYYKKVVLLFSGAQVFITSLQLSQSISSSQFDAGKWGSLFVLVAIALGIYYIHKKG